jgi:hypothetical protein
MVGKSFSFSGLAGFSPVVGGLTAAVPGGVTVVPGSGYFFKIL